MTDLDLELDLDLVHALILEEQQERHKSFRWISAELRAAIAHFDSNSSSVKHSVHQYNVHHNQYYNVHHNHNVNQCAYCHRTWLWILTGNRSRLSGPVMFVA